MNISDIVLFLKEHGQFYCQEKNFLKKFPEQYKIISEIKFPNEFTFQQKLYHYFNNDLNLHLGICQVCKKNRCKFISFNQGYKERCSRKCLGIDGNIKLKRKNTIKTKFGNSNEFYRRRYEKSKKTMFEKYGVENYSSTKECRNKVIKTNLNTYGVINYSQTSEFSKYHRKRIEYDSLTFDSNWEVILYKYCKKHNKEVEYQPNIHFEYYFENKLHYYQPDFLIEGKLYEVKGDQFFNGDKMICPFDRNSDELFEAKHQCMIQNNVNILRGDDIKRIKEMI